MRAPRPQTPRAAHVVLLVALVLAVTAAARPARAQAPADLAKQLQTDADYKVRLSAALALGRMRDKRAVPALTAALGDDVASIRAVCASALAQIVDRTIPAEQRAAAATKLERMSQSDSDSGARLAASRALEALALVERLARPRSPQGAIYVAIEPLKAEGGLLPAPALAELNNFARDVLLLSHETAVVDWPSGKAPTAAELAQAKVRAAFTLMPSVATLTVAPEGKQTSASCQVKVIFATYPSRAVRAFYSGGAKVNGASHPEAVEATKVRCVRDLLSHLSKKEIGPALDAAAAKEGK